MKSTNCSHQRGIISIMMAMMLIIITGLIVLGFAQLSRRTQRETLDAQLSSQAYYAAESGINDAVKAIKTQLDSGVGVASKTDCGASSSGPYVKLDGKVDNANNVAYTCLLINPNSPEVSGTIGTKPSVFSLAVSNPNLSSISVHWDAAGSLPSGSNYGQCPAASAVRGQDDFPVSNRWDCMYGVLRVDLVATDNLSSGALRSSANSMTTFLVPTKNGPGNTNFNSKKVVAAACRPTGGCNVTIGNMGGHRNYSIRVSSVYQNGIPMRITGVTTKGESANFVGQAQIDSTGRAQDVLRRLVEVVNLQGGTGNDVPVAALVSGDSVCKRFKTYYASKTFFWIDGNFAGDDGNPLCSAVPVNIPPPYCNKPEDIMFVLDYSESMKTRWGTTTRRDELISVVENKFLQKPGLVSPTGAHVGLVTFNGKDGLQGGSKKGDVAHLTPLTSDVNLLSSTLQNTPLAWGTVYHEGLQLAVPELNSPDARANTPKTVIFISDGQPTEDRSAYQPFVDTLGAEGVDVYTIGIVPDSTAAQVLQQMVRGRGTYASANVPADLDYQVSQIADKVACQ